MTAAGVLGCAPEESVTDRPAGGVHVDSALSIDVHLERFRRVAGARVGGLRGAAPSTRALVDRWAAALAARDTSALVALAVDRAEFAWLYYPESHFARSPYEMPPGLLWSRITAASDAGLRRSLMRVGGARLTVIGFRCEGPEVTEGRNLLIGGCTVDLRVDGAPLAAERLFGTILARDGAYKFLSYANDR